MKLVFYEDAWEDYLNWQSHDRKLLAKLNGLISECTRTPFTGRGKPEPLRFQVGGRGGSMSGIASFIGRPMTAY